MVFQDFQLFPHLTAIGNVMEVLRSGARAGHGRGPRGRRPNCSRGSGLADRAGAYPRLSGGQKQRVAIARVLAMRPADCCATRSPVRLDPELKGEVLAVLENLKAGAV